MRPTAVLNVSLGVVSPPDASPRPDTSAVVVSPDSPGKPASDLRRRDPGGAKAEVENSAAEALAWDVRYFSPRSLDLVPVAQQYGIPTAPDGEAVRTGEVRLEVFIEVDGSVAHVNVISVGDLPPEYGAAASSALYRSRFSPGMRAGVAVPVRMKVVVKYGVTDP